MSDVDRSSRESTRGCSFARVTTFYRAIGFTGSPASAPPSAASAGGDIVRLKNGGLLRGKISELVPGDAVTIVTLTGKTREFAMNAVEYAGPEADAPTKERQAAFTRCAHRAPPPAGGVTLHGSF